MFGTFVLLLVDLPKASRQLARVLKPGGKAVFIENSALNPLLMAARSKVCGRFGVPQYSDDHEHPLTRRDIATLQSVFPDGAFSFMVICRPRSAWPASVHNEISR